MFRLLKLVLFVAGVCWGFQHYRGKQTDSLAPVVAGQEKAAGWYSSSAAGDVHVIVYGIQCIGTTRYTKQLDQNHISYLYEDINAAFNGPAFEDIKPRLAASGISPADIKGPLVDINGRFYLMPSPADIRAALNGR
jgi:hypothetical protein